MSKGIRQLIALAFCAAPALAGTPQAGLAAENSTDIRPKTYSSPRAVFDAYRQAREKQDWRTVYLCWTPHDRNVLISEAFFGCQMHPDDPDVLGVLKKYGVTEDAIEAEYFKRYKAKHGVDLAKLHADRVATDKASHARRKQEPEASSDSGPVPVDPAALPPQPPEDLELLHEAVCADVSDNEGFYVAVSKLFAARDPDVTAPIGPLERLTLRGNRATGSAMTTLFHIEGPLNKKVGQTISTPFRFRKVDGGWFLELESAK